MSLTKSATRRLSLMAGSSLIAASLSAAASFGAALAPTAAAAQATCVTTEPPVVGGNATNSVTLPAGTYNPGVTCTYLGDTATVSTSGAITVSTTGGVPADPLVNGVNLRATGTDDITWNSTAGTVTGGNQTNGPVIDARTAAGDINISTTDVGATNSTVTHGIFAQSSSGGNVSVSASSSGFAGISATSSSGVAGIEARSLGGNGDVTVTTTGDVRVDGRLYGIRAETVGSGDLTINLQKGGNINGAAAGINAGGAVDSAAIFAKTGTGLLRIDAGAVGSNGNQAANALRIETGGDAILNFTDLFMEGNQRAVVDMTTAAGTQTVLSHTGAWGTATTAFASSLRPNRLLIRAQGGGDLTINSGGPVAGNVDFSAATGDLTWNIEGRWDTVGANNFGPGDATLILGEAGKWIVGLQGTGNNQPGSSNSLEVIVVDFGAGEDRVTNNGVIVIGPKSSNVFGRYSANTFHEAEARLVGLETFENAGTIFFGSAALPGQAVDSSLKLPERSYATGPDFTETDYVNDDVLLMPGTHWIGTGNSRLVMDAFLIQNQSACDVSLRNPGVGPTGQVSGEMPAADCLGLQGGSTEGVTNILINQLATGDRGGAVRIVLVDVSGGTSEGGHFVLDPMNFDYNPDQGGYLDLGYLIMPLVYDAEAQQHVLLGTAGANAWQTAGWATAAHDVWRTSAASWFDRQADLRGGLEQGVGGGIWMRTATEFANRDVIHVQQAGTSAFAFDNSYEQNTYAITGGADLLVGSGNDSAWAVGLMAGYANSEVNYDASPNTAQFDSWNGGLYASFLAGGLHVDALVSVSKADIKAGMPGLNLRPTGTLLDTNLLSVGAQLEAGWRFPVMETAFIEPLAGVSYVRTTWDEMTIASDDPLRPGIDVEFDDPTSLRANVGARFALDQQYGAYRAQYSVLARVWEEFEGEHAAILHNTQEDILVGDAFTGQISELGLGASIYGSVVSGFLNVGGKWGDDYEAQNASVGVRVAW